MLSAGWMSHSCVAVSSRSHFNALPPVPVPILISFEILSRKFTNIHLVSAPWKSYKRVMTFNKRRRHFFSSFLMLFLAVGHMLFPMVSSAIRNIVCFVVRKVEP